MLSFDLHHENVAGFVESLGAAIGVLRECAVAQPGLPAKFFNAKADNLAELQEIFTLTYNEAMK